MLALPATAGTLRADHPCRHLQPRADIGTSGPGIADLGIALPGLAARVAAGRRLRIVMLGSSSTAGPDPDDRSRTYPASAARVLQRLWGSHAVEVVNKGVGGEAISEMLQRFDRDIYALAPDLVIWQLGVNDLFRYREPEIAGLEPVVRKAVHDIRSHGIPVVLLDLQYAPRVLRAAGHDDMEALIGRVARLEKAGLFQRFALMQHLAGGVNGAGNLTEKDGLHMLESVHACIGELLGNAIAASAAIPSRQELAGHVQMISPP